MKTVEYFYWMLPSEIVGKKPHKSRWMMDEATAAGYPGAVKIESTRVLREQLDTEEDFKERARSRPEQPQPRPAQKLPE